MRPPAPAMQEKVKQQHEQRLLASRNQLLSARILDKMMTDPKYADKLGLEQVEGL